MNFYRLSSVSMAACLFGLVALLIVGVYSAREMKEKRAAIAELLRLDERIDTFSSASGGLLILGADPDLWQAYRTEARELQGELRQLGEVHPDALKSAHRIQVMVDAIVAATAAAGSEVLTSDQSTGIDPLDLPMRSRIVMQQVANQGIALDTALDVALAQRQQAIAREADWLGAGLGVSALLFGALCVVAFALVNRRMALPARTLVATLERVRAGDTEARSAVTGNDELSRLGQTLNTLLDERQAADQAVEERQHRLERALTDLSGARDHLERAQRIGAIGSWDINYETGLIEWSKQALDILCIDPRRFPGTVEDFFELVHPEDLERQRDKRTDWLHRGGEFDEECRIVRPDGETRWVHVRARLEFAPDGKPAFSTGTLHDITDRRRRETKLRELLELVEGSEDLCGIVDNAYRYRWANRAYLDRYALSRDELDGRSMEEVLGEEYFRREIKPRVDRCLAGEPQRFETERAYADLGTRTLLARYYPVDVPGAAHRRVGAVITDVTAIREAESRAAQQSRLLDIAGRAGNFGGWSIDLESQTVDWSDITADIHAMPHDYKPTVEEAIGFYAPEYLERIREVFTACAERGRSYDEMLQIIDADEHRRWVRTIGDAIRDDAGRIIRVEGAFQDITETRETELERQRLADQMATLLTSIADGFVAFDADWRYVYVNAQAAKMIGKPEEELLGTSLWAVFPGLSGTQSEAALRQAKEQHEPGSAEEFFEPLNAWFETRTYPWEQGVAVFFRDVSETHRMLKVLKQQGADLRQSRDELSAALGSRQALINSLPAHIALLDRAGDIVDVNEQWRHFGEENDFEDSGFGVGSNYIRICESASGDCAEEAETVAEGLRQVLSGDRETFALEYPCHAPDEQRWFRVTFNRLTADPAVKVGAVAMHVDITERKLAEQKLERLAYEDPLTGLLSRNGFERQLRTRLQDANWPATGRVAMLDVVNLRDINSAYGYATGDRLLVETGRRLRAGCGKLGLAGRAGGDDFIAYLAPGPDEPAEDMLAHLGKSMEEPFELGRIRIEIKVAIGFTVVGTRRRKPGDLIREAELALFESRSKIGAPSQVLGYTAELGDRTRKRVRLTEELRSALHAEEFELHFQPKVNLADGSLISAEALLRWHHPERGLQPPGLFIPIAEQSQLIGPIGDWAMRNACRQLHDWRAAGMEIVRVSVNVSMVQLTLGGFPDKVRAALAEHDIRPSDLSLELTESVFERQSDKLLAELRELHEIGVRLSLDDFGTGYSSLLYLQRYPFDEIKIDRAFVSRLLDDDFSRDIVRSVVDVADALNAEVVAEGIESPAIVAALREIGVRIGQGFYYSVPLESEDFRWLLETRSRLPLGTNRTED